MRDSHLVIVGGGFAGVWAAVAAARARKETGDPRELEITLLSDSDVLTLRPRLYLGSREDAFVPLAPRLQEIGVRLRLAEVTSVEAPAQRLILRGGDAVAYDGLVVAVGSRAYRPELPGLRDVAFDIDTLAGAARFWAAVEASLARDADPVIAVIGAGFTGIELVTELSARARCVLIDPTGGFTTQMPEDGARTIDAALHQGRVRRCFGHRVAAVDEDGVLLSDGSRVEASIVVWTGGMRAHPLTECIEAPRDRLGRLHTDEYLAVAGHERIYAAGDAALFRPDGHHEAPMSCQFAIPSGIFAGHNAAALLLGLERQPFRRDQYVTCIDLGRSGALLTDGWERVPVMKGEAAKSVKRNILEMICPPQAPGALLAAADPERIRAVAIER